MTYKQGDIVDYKIRPGRGRPSMGTIIEDKGDILLIETPGRKRIQIPQSSVLGMHVTRYSPRQRRLL